MTKILNNDQKTFFKENGFLFPIKILSEERVLSYRKNLEEYEKSKGNTISGNDRHTPLDHQTIPRSVYSNLANIEQSQVFRMFVIPIHCACLCTPPNKSHTQLPLPRTYRYTATPLFIPSN